MLMVVISLTDLLMCMNFTEFNITTFLIYLISRRFDQASLALPAAIEDVLVKAINNSDES